MSRNRSTVLTRTRRRLRKAERAVGFASAVHKGRLGDYLLNRAIGRAVGRLTRGLYR